MRVTQFTLYNNFLINHQKDLNNLKDIQTKIATGKKIQNMYDEPTIYTRFLKLDEEINSFTQIKNSANFALNFARETDTTINDIVTSLTSFKTKLLNAANDTHDETSRKAIVSELKGLLKHLKDLANTSIDGKYIFSGSAFDKKPIDDNYKYQGNDKYVKAFLGAGVEREYNIPGSEIFFGRDNDYSKELTTNIPRYNMMKAHPEFVVRGSDGKLYIDKTNPNPDAPGAVPVNEPITEESEIRMLTGVEDIDNGDGTYSDGISYFYILGKKSNGENINAKIALSNSDSVKDLLDKIGELYGNTSTDKVVDVSLNADGEIQIKDMVSGKMLTDFYMVASDKDEDSIDDLVRNGDYIVEFQKSNFMGIKNLNTLKANNSYFNNKIFKFGSEFVLDNNSRRALPGDLIKEVLGKGEVSDGRISTPKFLRIQGIDSDGNSVDKIFTIQDKSTMEDLLNFIKDAFNDKVDVKLENGEIILVDNTIDFTQKSNIVFEMSAYEDTDNDNIFNEVDDKKISVFRSKDISNYNKLYFSKNANTLFSNVSQIINDTYTYFREEVDSKGNLIRKRIISTNENAQKYATNDTTLIETMGDESIPKFLNLEFKDIEGNFKKAKVELRDAIKEIKAEFVSNNKKIYFDTTGKSNQFDKYYNVMGKNIIDSNEKLVGVKYLKVSDGTTTDVIEITEDTTFEDIVNATSLLTGYDNGKFTTANSNVTITLEDENKNDIIAGFKSNFQIDLNNDGKISYGEIFNIFDQKGNLTGAHTSVKVSSYIDPITCQVCQKEEINKGVTYQQLEDVISQIGSNIVSPNSIDVYSKNLENAKNSVEAYLDEKGRLNIVDKKHSPSKMDFSIYSASLESKFFYKIDDKVNTSGTTQTFSITVDGVSYSMSVDDKEKVSKFIEDINSGKLKDSSGNSLDVKAYFKSGHIYLDFSNVKGEIENIDDAGLETNFGYRDDASLSFQANDAITIDSAENDFFETLKKAIDSVSNGYNYANANSSDPRNFGIQGAIKAIDHVMDRVRRSHAKIGALSQEFEMSIERVNMLTVNVQELQSENIDTDLGEAAMKLNSLQTTYQALLASVAKINNLTLLNYLR